MKISPYEGRFAYFKIVSDVCHFLLLGFRSLEVFGETTPWSGSQQFTSESMVKGTHRVRMKVSLYLANSALTSLSLLLGHELILMFPK